MPNPLLHHNFGESILNERLNLFNPFLIFTIVSIVMFSVDNLTLIPSSVDFAKISVIAVKYAELTETES